MSIATDELTLSSWMVDDFNIDENKWKTRCEGLPVHQGSLKHVSCEMWPGDCQGHRLAVRTLRPRLRKQECRWRAWHAFPNKKMCQEIKQGSIIERTFEVAWAGFLPLVGRRLAAATAAMKIKFGQRRTEILKARKENLYLS